MSFDEPSRRFLETYSAAGTACTGAGVRRYEQVLLGTWNVVLLVDRPAEEISGEKLDRAAAEAFQLMMRMEEELSKFQPESEVSLMNATAARSSFSTVCRLFFWSWRFACLQASSTG